MTKITLQEMAQTMNQRTTQPVTEWATVDVQGRLVLPPDAAAKLGLIPGPQVRLEPLKNGLKLHRPVTQLVKLYLEPTDNCNIACRTCFRNACDAPMGRMSAASLAAILVGLSDFDTVPTVFFGGIGEPLFHPRTPEWIAQAKQRGARVELITNGPLLTQKKTRQLIDAGLDVLWVSLDGVLTRKFR